MLLLSFRTCNLLPFFFSLRLPTSLAVPHTPLPLRLSFCIPFSFLLFPSILFHSIFSPLFCKKTPYYFGLFLLFTFYPSLYEMTIHKLLQIKVSDFIVLLHRKQLLKRIVGNDHLAVRRIL